MAIIMMMTTLRLEKFKLLTILLYFVTFMMICMMIFVMMTRLDQEILIIMIAISISIITY